MPSNASLATQVKGGRGRGGGVRGRESGERGRGSGGLRESGTPGTGGEGLGVGGGGWPRFPGRWDAAVAGWSEHRKNCRSTAPWG